MITAGSSHCNKELYIPLACTIFLGTSMLIPLNVDNNAPMGEPECHIPSSLCPLVLIINGAICLPKVL